MGDSGCGRARAAFLDIAARCGGCGSEGYRRLLVSRGNDGAGGSGASGRAFRLACGACGPPCAGLRGEIVHAGVRGRDRGHRVPLERRHGRGADAGCLRGGPTCRGAPAALSVHLCVHCERRELRAADLESREPRCLRSAHAAAAQLAPAIRHRLAGFDRRHVHGSALDPASGAARRHRSRRGGAGFECRGASGVRWYRRDRHPSPDRIGPRLATRDCRPSWPASRRRPRSSC